MAIKERMVEGMPKVVLTSAQKEAETVESIIRGYAGFKRIEIPELAKRAGIPVGTIYHRIHNPDTFKLGELKRLIHVLGVSDEDKLRILQKGGGQA